MDLEFKKGQMIFLINAVKAMKQSAMLILKNNPLGRESGKSPEEERVPDTLGSQVKRFIQTVCLHSLDYDVFKDSLQRMATLYNETPKRLPRYINPNLKLIQAYSPDLALAQRVISQLQRFPESDFRFLQVVRLSRVRLMIFIRDILVLYDQETARVEYFIRSRDIYQFNYQEHLLEIQVNSDNITLESLSGHTAPSLSQIQLQNLKLECEECFQEEAFQKVKSQVDWHRREVSKTRL